MAWFPSGSVRGQGRRDAGGQFRFSGPQHVLCHLFILQEVLACLVPRYTSASLTLESHYVESLTVIHKLQSSRYTVFQSNFIILFHHLFAYFLIGMLITTLHWCHQPFEVHHYLRIKSQMICLFSNNINVKASETAPNALWKGSPWLCQVLWSVKQDAIKYNGSFPTKRDRQVRKYRGHFSMCVTFVPQNHSLKSSCASLQGGIQPLTHKLQLSCEAQPCHAHISGFTTDRVYMWDIRGRTGKKNGELGRQ